MWEIKFHIDFESGTRKGVFHTDDEEAKTEDEAVQVLEDYYENNGEEELVDDVDFEMLSENSDLIIDSIKNLQHSNIPTELQEED
jgi:hypothetical protein